MVLRGALIPSHSATFAGREAAFLNSWGHPARERLDGGDCSPERVLDGLSVAERGGRRLVTDVQTAGGPLSPARYCEDENSGFRQILVRKMEQNCVVCSSTPIVGKNSGYGGNCPGEHPNDSGRPQSRTQPSKPRHCRHRKTGGREPKGKEIPPCVCAASKECTLVCAEREARSIADVSEIEGERTFQAVEGRGGLRPRREFSVPGSAIVRAVPDSLCVTILPASL